MHETIVALWYRTIGRLLHEDTGTLGYTTGVGVSAGTIALLLGG